MLEAALNIERVILSDRSASSSQELSFNAKKAKKNFMFANLIAGVVIVLIHAPLFAIFLAKDLKQDTRSTLLTIDLAAQGIIVTGNTLVMISTLWKLRVMTR